MSEHATTVDRLLQAATIAGLGSSQRTAQCFPVANVSSLSSRRECRRHREAVPCPIREMHYRLDTNVISLRVSRWGIVATADRVHRVCSEAVGPPQ